MALSPNYSWPEPDDSSYVKFGADAMRDLGDAIDATLYEQLSALIHPFLLMGA